MKRTKCERLWRGLLERPKLKGSLPLLISSACLAVFLTSCGTSGVDIPTLQVKNTKELGQQYKIDFNRCLRVVDLPTGDYSPAVASEALIKLRESEVEKAFCVRFLTEYLDGVAEALRQ